MAVQRFVVQGTKTGENGVFYGTWLRFVSAKDEHEAAETAARLVKTEGAYTAATVTVTMTRRINP